MRKILFLGLTDEDSENLARADNFSQFEFESLGTPDEVEDPLTCDVPEFSRKLAEVYLPRKDDFSGVIAASDFPPSLLSALAAERLGLRGPTVGAMLRCEHKYWSRLCQREVVPHAIPAFALVDPARPASWSKPPLPFPFWLKPVKSYASYLGFMISDRATFDRVLKLAGVELPQFSRAFNALLERGHPPAGAEEGDGRMMIAESIIQGRQCTLEGFVRSGQVFLVGIVDSIRFPNLRSFKRFDYPSSLPDEVQLEMFEISKKVVLQAGLDDCFFNIEFFWSAGSFSPHIIEINPRIACQFADLYEKVDGVNSYESLIKIAIGEAPRTLFRKGEFRCASSFVLRIFEDKLVTRIPGEEDLELLRREMPDAVVKIRASVGSRLSAGAQDSYSFRFGMINLGGKSKSDLHRKFARCLTLLPFEFSSVVSGDQALRAAAS